MPKLRVVKERVNENPASPDLRGLGDPELFQNSGFEVHLLVTRAPDKLHLNQAAEKYHLTVKPNHPIQGAFHLQTTHHEPGEHKKEALALYVAALEIQRISPTAHCLIFQTSGLKVLLRDRIQGKKDSHSDEIERLSNEGLAADSKFSIHHPVSMALCQAGLIPDASHSEWTHLSSAEIETAHAVLSHGKEHPSGLRRAG